MLNPKITAQGNLEFFFFCAIFKVKLECVENNSWLRI